MSMFNAKAELERIRLNRVPKNQYYKSKLDPFTNELLELKKAGVSIAEIHFFLKDLKVNVT